MVLGSQSDSDSVAVLVVVLSSCVDSLRSNVLTSSGSLFLAPFCSTYLMKLEVLGISSLDVDDEDWLAVCLECFFGDCLLKSNKIHSNTVLHSDGRRFDIVIQPLTCAVHEVTFPLCKLVTQTSQKITENHETDFDSQITTNITKYG